MKRGKIFSGILIKSTIILIIGALLGLVAGVTVDQVYRNYLSSRANTLAQAFDTEKVAALKHSVTEDTAPIYNEVRTKLSLVREVNPDARFVYLMAQDQNGIYFLADSEPEDSPDHSTNGEQYNDASTALVNIFSNQRSFTEGPLQDDWGTWLSALAPMIDPNTHKVVAIIGVDVPAFQYMSLVAIAAAVPFLVTAVLVGFLIITSMVRRRRVEALQFRSELVSIASHELRTPLTGIRWAAETLEHDTLTEPQRILISSVHNSALHLEESIEDILQLASLENNARMKREPNDITVLFREVFATQRLPAQKKGVTLEFDSQWPAELIIVCDALRMRRVFNNIISNSVKYSRDNSVVTVTHTIVDGAHCIAVRDKGIGIPQKEQDKIFSGFYRASNAVKSEVNGTGMGLYLSRAIIEQHGGKMWIESIENEGTTVYLKLL